MTRRLTPDMTFGQADKADLWVHVRCAAGCWNEVSRPAWTFPGWPEAKLSTLEKVRCKECGNRTNEVSVLTWCPEMARITSEELLDWANQVNERNGIPEYVG